jgi:hypothetical protein
MNLHLAFPAITLDQVAAELQREAQQRRDFYPGRVAKGNMLQAEADRQLALAAAWREDLERIRACWSTPGASPAAPAHGFSWRDRRAALLREIGLREKHYPEWIAGGRLLERDAVHQLACLSALLAVYEDGWDWRGSDGSTPFHSAVADQEFTALRADVDARHGRSQHELALA